jgi:hypothetical protein
MFCPCYKSYAANNVAEACPLQLYLYLCILFRAVDGIFVLIAVGSSYVFHGGPINKAEDTTEILQREKHCVLVNTANCFTASGLTYELRAKQYNDYGNYVHTCIYFSTTTAILTYIV